MVNEVVHKPGSNAGKVTTATVHGNSTREIMQQLLNINNNESYKTGSRSLNNEQANPEPGRNAREMIGKVTCELTKRNTSHCAGYLCCCCQLCS